MFRRAVRNDFVDIAMMLMRYACQQRGANLFLCLVFIIMTYLLLRPQDIAPEAEAIPDPDYKAYCQRGVSVYDIRNTIDKGESYPNGTNLRKRFF